MAIPVERAYPHTQAFCHQLFVKSLGIRLGRACLRNMAAYTARMFVQHYEDYSKENDAELLVQILLTSVCTMLHLCCLILFTNSCTLTFRSCRIFMSMASKVIKVPVRPTPALQCTTSGGPAGGWIFLTRFRKPMRAMAYLGTPWSGQRTKWQWVTLRGGSLGFVF